MASMTFKKIITLSLIPLFLLSPSTALGHPHNVIQTPPVGTIETTIDIPITDTLLKQGDRYLGPEQDAAEIEKILSQVPSAQERFNEYRASKKKAQRWLHGGIGAGITSIVTGVLLMVLTQRPAPGLVLGGLGSFSYGIGLSRSRTLEESADQSLDDAITEYNQNCSGEIINVIKPEREEERKPLAALSFYF